MEALEKITKVLLLVSIILLVISYFQKDNLPRQSEILGELMQEPVQIPTTAKYFQYSQKDVSYRIIPQYDYELHGLVVSQNDNDVWYSRFKKIDPSNTKDYCVLWGKNLSSNIFESMKFYTNEFVCHMESKDQKWVEAFSMTNISNNHLLTSDEGVFEAIRQASVGDQIHLKGYLIRYETTDLEGKKGSRGTSTTRTDEGMGACETIYVEQFEILKKGNVLWRAIFIKSQYAALVFVVLLVIEFLISVIFAGRSRPQKPTEMPNRDILLPNYPQKDKK